MRLLAIAIIVFLVQLCAVSSLTPDETCELCQLSLKTVFWHFGGKIPSKQKLTHQLKHECNRHYNYRRRCMLTMKEHVDLIYREMSAEQFKPIQSCHVMKECKRLQSPITMEFYKEHQESTPYPDAPPPDSPPSDATPTPGPGPRLIFLFTLGYEQTPPTLQ